MSVYVLWNVPTDVSKTAGRSIIFGEVEREGDGIESDGDYGNDVESEMRDNIDGGQDEGNGGDIDSMRVDTALLAGEDSQHLCCPSHPARRASVLGR